MLYIYGYKGNKDSSPSLAMHKLMKPNHADCTLCMHQATTPAAAAPTADTWSDLHRPLLELILDRLPLLDRPLFACVCRSWLAVLRGRPAAAVPLLMLPDHDDPAAETRILYSPFDDTCRRVRLPGSSGKSCFASSHGWLLFGDDDCSGLFLLNPVTKARVDLPPTKASYGRSAARHAVVSSSPDEPGCVVMLVLDARFVFCKVGDLAWSDVEGNTWSLFDHCNAVVAGGCVHFFRNWSLQTVSLRLSGLRGGEQPALATVELGTEELKRYLDADMRNPRFLVEHAGELLLVFADLDTSAQRVFRADVARAEWVEVADLGRRELFLGKTGSFAVSTTAGRGNVVHFTRPPTEEGPAPEAQGRGERRPAAAYDVAGRMYHEASELVHSIWTRSDSKCSNCYGSNASHWILLSI